jgi:molybdenum cofactor cytidylyltransferase
MNTGILMLAAGSGVRFGSDKRAATLTDGRTLLLASVENAVASALPVRVCLRPGDETLAAAVNNAGAAVLYCAGAESGMGHTLAEGISQMNRYDGVIVALGDMPLIQPATYTRVAAALLPGGICQPRCGDRPGHPVGFSRTWFASLARLAGDRGARGLVRENAGRVTVIDVDDPGILRDVDTPGDLP